MANEDSIQPTLNSISWQLKRIADTLERIHKKELREEIPQYDKETSRLRRLIADA